MSEATCNGLPVIRATVSMPLHGAWVACVRTDTETEIVGRATLAISGVEFRGTVGRGSTSQGTGYWSIVGGAHGLPNLVGPKFYSNVPASIPIRDLLSETGETLSTLTVAATIAPFWQKWVREASSATIALTAMLDALSASWRILADGTVLVVGSEAWSTVSTSGAIKDEDPSFQRIEVWTDTPSLVPGVIWQGRRLSYVVHRISESKSLTEAWYE